MKSKKTIVRFVVDKELDISNHVIGVWTYKNKMHSFMQAKNDRYEKLLKLSPGRQRKSIAKEISWLYEPKRLEKLRSLAADMNDAWAKIEKEFIRRIEKIHRRSFAFGKVRGVLSSADRFGYDIDGKWFATSIFRNKYAGVETAMHELMHFMFLTYYQEACERQGLSEKQIWDIKESFTTLLNVEFDDLRLNADRGYPEHKSVRDAIKKSWLKSRDFKKTLAAAIKTEKASVPKNS
jgi:hypothetical protein